ncbi:MAG: hypothetical protein J5676_02520 [Bacteroidaceae bacterium]|nr:hypothetical protein [Bacteroidaceae bacterium]
MENRLYNSNNRAVINEFGDVRQVTNYYPFGGVFSTTAYNRGDDLLPYKYNGKELDRTHGLDWYDYGARQHDPFMPGFTSLDPLCEKYIIFLRMRIVLINMHYLMKKKELAIKTIVEQQLVNLKI